MKKRSTRKSSAADLLVSSPIAASPDRSASETSKQFEFNLGAFNTASSSKRKNNDSSSKRKTAIASSTCVLFQSVESPPRQKTIGTISDLKEMASSRFESLKRHLDRSNSEILKDIEASQSRLHKRFKLQTQACQQVMDEAEKEYKKMSERISESREAMKASYLEFLAEAQATASRVCKTTIPELSQSFEKTLDVLRSRHGIPSAVA